MPSFDLNLHFEKNKERFFFDQYTYADLKKLVSHFAELFRNEKKSFIGLQFTSPYLQMGAMLAAIHSKKIAVLISPLESGSTIENLKSQVAFEKIFRDSDADLSASEIVFQASEFEDHAVVVFSSGSTNAPKGIALTFGNLFYSAMGFAEFFKQNENDISLMNLPHHHVGGMMTLWRAFFTGGKLSTNASERFDFISVVPLQLSRDLKDSKKLSQLKSCRVILVGGAKFSEELKNTARAQNLSVYETYGMSETASLVTIDGVALPYRQIHLSSDGFFLVKGKTLSPGIYRNQHFYPLELDKDKFYKTNDVGHLTADGRFQFSHRADLIFISGGENINPLTVEDVARSYPGIKDAYLVSVPDEKWGEMGVLLFESDKEIDSELLKEFLKSKLHPHHVPKKFYPMKFSLAGQLKPKRSELKKVAEKIYLKEIFSHTYIENTLSSELIVFLHGFTGSKDEFKFIYDDFKKSHSILAIDLPGHGKTKADDFFSTTDVLKKLAAFINLFSTSPVLYGYSMGGRIALQLSLNYLNPKLLVLESAGPGLESSQECSERLKKDLALFDSYSSAKDFLIDWYKSDLFKKYSESKSFAADIENKSSHDIGEWKKSQSTLSQGLFPLQSENLKSLSQKSFPVVYLFGSEDAKYKNYAGFYPKSFEIAGASHNPNKTHPAEITAILKSILK